MALDIGSGIQSTVSTILAWGKWFGIVFLVALLGLAIFLIIWNIKKYPYKVVVLDIDKEGRIRNIISKAKAGRKRKRTADGTRDYFVLKIQRQKIEFNSPALVDEIHRGGSIGTLLLARFENDVVVPMIGETVNKDFKLKVISKEVGMQQMLTARDIDELTKIKKSMWLTIAPYMIIVMGFMIVCLFLMALLQQIGTLIEKIPSPQPQVIQGT
jgi:hypothetical protein